MEYVLAANAALALFEKLLPIISDKVKSGEITPEQQQVLRAKYEALKAAGDAAFTGPEWDVT